jgi:regulator of sirC expression with transglutaminase-like and TPR domain
MPAGFRFEAPSALEYFTTLVADDATLPVLEAAVAVAQDEDPGLDPQGVLDEVDALAVRLRRRVPADAAPLQRLRLLNRYFFQELGFAGNVNDYHDRRNSYLPEVLRTRRGIPITLALLYVELATQLGLQARGVAFPGHFLVKLHLQGGNQPGEVVMDPFSGRSLSRDDLEEWLVPYRRRRGLAAGEAPLALFLQDAPPRAVIARLLRNLKAIHRGARDWHRLVAVMHRLVILLPDDWDERRDRGLALAEIGCPERAAADLVAYLEHRADMPDAGAMRRLLARWRRLPGERLQ